MVMPGEACLDPLPWGPTYISEGKLCGTRLIPTLLTKVPRLASLRDSERLRMGDLRVWS